MGQPNFMGADPGTQSGWVFAEEMIAGMLTSRESHGVQVSQLQRFILSPLHRRQSNRACRNETAGHENLNAQYSFLKIPSPKRVDTPIA
jgi:hypothetical protein